MGTKYEVRYWSNKKEKLVETAWTNRWCEFAATRLVAWLSGNLIYYRVNYYNN